MASIPMEDEEEWDDSDSTVAAIMAVSVSGTGSRIGGEAYNDSVKMIPSFMSNIAGCLTTAVTNDTDSVEWIDTPAIMESLMAVRMDFQDTDMTTITEEIDWDETPSILESLMAVTVNDQPSDSSEASEVVWDESQAIMDSLMAVETNSKVEEDLILDCGEDWDESPSLLELMAAVSIAKPSMTSKTKDSFGTRSDILWTIQMSDVELLLTAISEASQDPSFDTMDLFRMLSGDASHVSSSVVPQCLELLRSSKLRHEALLF